MDYDEAVLIASEIVEKWNLSDRKSGEDSLLEDIALTILRTYKIGSYGVGNRSKAGSSQIGKRSRTLGRKSRKGSKDSC